MPKYDVIVIGAGHMAWLPPLTGAGRQKGSGAGAPRVGRRLLRYRTALARYRVSSAAYLTSLLQERIVRELDLPRFGYRWTPKTGFFSAFPDAGISSCGRTAPNPRRDR